MSKFSISIQPTNNENIVKFVANSFITRASSYEFNNIDEAKPSPLAQELFYLPFVKTVYISQNFVAIEKYNIVTWDDVQEEVATAISDFLNSGKDIIIVSEDAPAKVPVTVYAESTPNPAVVKFVANKPLVDGTFEFKNIEEAKDAPLAAALFSFPFVNEIFMSANYVSISKYNVVEWQEVTMQLREFITNYIADGKPILNDEILQQQTKKENTASVSEEKQLSDFDKEIVAILDEYVKPAVASDGGNIAFDSFNEATKTVKVVLQGACSGCPSSTITLKNGIETMLKEMLQGRVMAVEAING